MALNKTIRGTFVKGGGDYYLFSGKFVKGLPVWKFYLITQFGNEVTTLNADLLPNEDDFIECNGIESELPGQYFSNIISWPLSGLQMGGFKEDKPTVDEILVGNPWLLPQQVYLDPQKDIQGLLFRLNANDAYYDEESGAFIWPDFINGYGFANSGSNKPSIESEVEFLNNLPAVNFATNEFAISQTIHDFSGSNTITLFSVFILNDPNPTGSFYSLINSTNSLSFLQGGTSIRSEYISGSADATGWEANIELEEETGYVVCSTFKLSQFGTYFSTKQTINGIPLAGEYYETNSNGQGVVDNSFAFIGGGILLADLLAYNRELSFKEIKELNVFLTGKYGLPFKRLSWPIFDNEDDGPPPPK